MAYTARKWRVLPLWNLTDKGYCSCPNGPACPSKPGKHPRLKAWQKLATSDTEQARRWWQQWPQANIGILGGDGLLFIDADSHDPARNGLENLEKLQAIYGPLPKTLMVRSGSGGVHHYYALPDGVEIASKGLDKFPGLAAFTGIDIKSTGGYIVAAPSFAHKDGQPYQLINAGAELALLPDAYIDLLREIPASAKSASQEWKQDRAQGGVIAAYNRAVTLTEILERNGYTRVGERYRRPDGSSASVAIRDGRDGQQSYHHSSTDKLSDGFWHDAFSVFCTLEHGGKVNEAVKGAARQLGLDQRTEATAHNAQRQGAQQTTQGAVPGAEGTPDDSQDESDQRSTQANQLIAIARGRAEAFFSTPEGEHYATMRIGKHKETMLISERGGAFKSWLMRSHYQLYGKVPNSTALASAIGLLESDARFGLNDQGPFIQEVYTRVGYHDGKLYLDLADKDWTVIEIDADGWRETKNAPVCFRHPNAMLPLPKPEPGGSLHDLRRFINVGSNEDWMLIASFLLGALHPKGPYSILVLLGEQGTAKTYATVMLRSVIDPSRAPTNTVQKDERDMAIYCQNARVAAFDNLSQLPLWLQNAFCRISTGAGLRNRSLYSDAEEKVFYARRPVILNGIEEIGTQGDFLDRCIVITLEAIEHRKDEQTIQEEFEEAHPRILGGLLDAASAALRNLSTAPKENLPRLADFARWTMAAEKNLGWEEGKWLDVYTTNRKGNVETELEASALARAIRMLMRECEQWTGLATELLAALGTLVPPETARSHAWPKDPTRLGGKLRRLAPGLRRVGITITSKHTGNGAMYTLIKGEPSGDATGDAGGAKSDATGDAEKGRGPGNDAGGAKSDADDAVFPLSLLYGTEEKTRKTGGENAQEGESRRAGNPASSASPSPGPLERVFKVGPAIVNQAPANNGTAALDPIQQILTAEDLTKSGKLQAIARVIGQPSPASEAQPAQPAHGAFSEAIAEILAWAQRHDWAKHTWGVFTFGAEHTEESWRRDVMVMFPLGNKGVVLQAMRMAADLRQIDAAEEAAHSPWWATESDTCAFCAAPGEGYSPEGKWCCTAHLAAVVSTPAPAEDDDLETAPRLPTALKLTIVQTEQRPDETPKQEGVPASLRFNPDWQQLSPRERIAAMAEALGHRAVTTAQGEAYGGSPALWGVHLPVTALSYILAALEAEFEG